MKDVEDNRCWYCNKRMTDPIEPPQPPRPVVAKFVLGFVGAILGMAVGLLLLGKTAEHGSWTVSLCGGIGFASGSALATLLFGKKKQEPPKA